jgi:hypothetical protein
VVTRLSDGTGNFDAERMLQQLPADLGIDAGKAAATVEELAKARKQTTLVQVGAGVVLGGLVGAGLVGDNKQQATIVHGLSLANPRPRHMTVSLSRRCVCVAQVVLCAFCSPTHFFWTDFRSNDQSSHQPASH